MYRKYFQNLEDWLFSKNRELLMIWGARQVGKSYLIKDLFVEQYFKNKYGFNEENRVLTIPFYFLPFYLKDLREKEKLD